MAVIVTTKTVPPFRIAVFPPSHDIVSRQLVQLGLWEQELTDAMLRHHIQHPPLTRVVDAGGNLG